MNNIVEAISNDIIKDVYVAKIANEILTPFEKEAQSGLGAFGKALVGSEKRALGARKARLAEELAQKTSDPKVLHAKNLVAKAEDLASNADSHPRMIPVKENYANAAKRYQNVSAGNDAALNKYVGFKAPLRAVSPEWYGAKAQNMMAGLKFNHAKKQYMAQKKRIGHDVMKEVELAKENLRHMEKEQSIDKLKSELNYTTQMHDAASAKTRSARKAVGYTGLGGYTAYKVNKARKDNNSDGQYMYAEASEKLSMIEKIADSILS